MLLIYSEHITARLAYVFQFLLQEINGFDFQITTNKDEFCAYQGPSLNYSNDSLKTLEFQIKPSGFLFLSSIEPCEAVIEKQDRNIRLLLRSKNIDSSLFDPFSAVFYLLSRFEEYLPYAPDEFGRFEAQSSVLYRNGLLETPIVEVWARELRQSIQKMFPAIEFKNRNFEALVTVDIDQAYAFKGRGIKKNILSFSKNLLNLQTSFLGWQLKSVLGNTDPFDSYSFLKRVQSTTGLPFIYFINAGKCSRYDKNLSLNSPHLKTLLRTIYGYASIGLHPSFYSNEIPAKFAEEKERLESILGHQITKSRQHFLKLKFPQTYRHLIEAGIDEDYSMGFASAPGFRAGTCTPFSWFDLTNGEVTKLKVFPITYMEGSLGEDLKMTSVQAEEKINSLTEEVKKYNGCHVSIWHNHTVNNLFFWREWQSVFERTTKKLKY